MITDEIRDILDDRYPPSDEYYYSVTINGNIIIEFRWFSNTVDSYMRCSGSNARLVKRYKISPGLSHLSSRDEEIDIEKLLCLL